MGSTCRSARLAISTNRNKEEALKALAAELGYTLRPKSRTFRIFGQEYILAKVARPSSSTQLPLPVNVKLWRNTTGHAWSAELNGKRFENMTIGSIDELVKRAMIRLDPPEGSRKPLI
jgi:hypothetical protein